MERAAPEALGREHATAGLRNGAGAVASGAAARTSRASIYFCLQLYDRMLLLETL